MKQKTGLRTFYASSKETDWAYSAAAGACKGQIFLDTTRTVLLDTTALMVLHHNRSMRNEDSNNAKSFQTFLVKLHHRKGTRTYKTDCWTTVTQRENTQHILQIYYDINTLKLKLEFPTAEFPVHHYTVCFGNGLQSQ